MSLEWSEVLGRLLFVVESRFASALTHAHVVRDLRGRIRIAAKRAEQSPEAILDAKPFSVICSRIHERCLRSSSGSNSTEDGGGDGREVPG
jgi:hypothetical protein